MDWKDAGPLLSFVGSLVGAGIGGFFAIRSVSAQVKRKLRDDCYASFVKFHAIISSASEPFGAGQAGWRDAYRTKLAAVEPVADELVALTHLTISADLSKRVHALRDCFREFDNIHRPLRAPEGIFPPEVMAKAGPEAMKNYPEKLRGMLDELTREFREALDPSDAPGFMM